MRPRIINARRELGNFIASRGASVRAGSPIKLGRGVRVHPTARLQVHPGGSIFLGEETVVATHAFCHGWRGTIQTGRRVSIGPSCVLYGHGRLIIGDDTLIAAHTVIVCSNHIYADPLTLIRDQGESQEGITIGSDVWIGANVTVLDGVEIGDGAVVAGGAVVTNDVKPFTVVAGVPARVIKQRGGDAVVSAGA